jgi:hypothetical protein
MICVAFLPPPMYTHVQCPRPESSAPTSVMNEENQPMVVMQVPPHWSHFIFPSLVFDTDDPLES